jgi:hypothetical protein
MSEGQGDPPADVRSFLPRPGEPVEQYAQRLRALHRDLTLVLEAVERGLAAAAEPADLAPPVPDQAPIEISPTVEEPPGPAGEPPRFRRAAPRVEVLPAASGESGRDDPTQQRRRGDAAPAPDPAGDAGPEPDAEPSGRERPRAARFPRRPSDAPAGYPREPEWVEDPDEAADGFTAPTFPTTGDAPQGLRVTPVGVVAMVAAWLVVVALLVAVLVS